MAVIVWIFFLLLILELGFFLLHLKRIDQSNQHGTLQSTNKKQESHMSYILDLGIFECTDCHTLRQSCWIKCIYWKNEYLKDNVLLAELKYNEKNNSIDI